MIQAILLAFLVSFGWSGPWHGKGLKYIDPDSGLNLHKDPIDSVSTIHVDTVMYDAPHFLVIFSDTQKSMGRKLYNSDTAGIIYSSISRPDSLVFNVIKHPWLVDHRHYFLDIQEAIDTASAYASDTSVCVVFIDVGTYTQSTIYCSSYVYLVGTGRYSTILKTNSATAVVIPSGVKTEIRYLSVNAPGNNYAIETKGAGYLRVEGCNVIGNLYGIYGGESFDSLKVVNSEVVVVGSGSKGIEGRAGKYEIETSLITASDTSSSSLALSLGIGLGTPADAYIKYSEFKGYIGIGMVWGSSADVRFSSIQSDSGHALALGLPGSHLPEDVDFVARKCMIMSGDSSALWFADGVGLCSLLTCGIFTGNNYADKSEQQDTIIAICSYFNKPLTDSIEVDGNAHKYGDTLFLHFDEVTGVSYVDTAKYALNVPCDSIKDCKVDSSTYADTSEYARAYLNDSAYADTAGYSLDSDKLDGYNEDYFLDTNTTHIDSSTFADTSEYARAYLNDSAYADTAGYALAYQNDSAYADSSTYADTSEYARAYLNDSAYADTAGYALAYQNDSAYADSSTYADTSEYARAYLNDSAYADTAGYALAYQNDSAYADSSTYADTSEYARAYLNDSAYADTAGYALKADSAGYSQSQFDSLGLFLRLAGGTMTGSIIYDEVSSIFNGESGKGGKVCGYQNGTMGMLRFYAYAPNEAFSELFRLGKTATYTYLKAYTTLDMENNSITDVGDPNSGDDVMDRDYADARYWNENQKVDSSIYADSAGYSQSQFDSLGLFVRVDGSTILTADWDIGDGRKILADGIRARDGAGLELYDDGGNGIFVKDGGNVGIGTANPAYKLHINGTMGVEGVATFKDTLRAESDITLTSSPGKYWLLPYNGGDITTNWCLATTSIDTHTYWQSPVDKKAQIYIGDNKVFEADSNGVDIDGNLDVADTLIIGEDLYFKTAYSHIWFLPYTGSRDWDMGTHSPDTTLYINLPNDKKFMLYWNGSTRVQFDSSGVDFKRNIKGNILTRGNETFSANSTVDTVVNGSFTSSDYYVVSWYGSTIPNGAIWVRSRATDTLFVQCLEADTTKARAEGYTYMRQK